MERFSFLSRNYRRFVLFSLSEKLIFPKEAMRIFAINFFRVNTESNRVNDVYGVQNFEVLDFEITSSEISR